MHSDRNHCYYYFRVGCFIGLVSCNHAARWACRFFGFPTEYYKRYRPVLGDRHTGDGTCRHSEANYRPWPIITHYRHANSNLVIIVWSLRYDIPNNNKLPTLSIQCKAIILSLVVSLYYKLSHNYLVSNNNCSVLSIFILTKMF